MAVLKADGTEANGNGGPWWAKDLRVVGPITFIALGLVYVLTVEVRTDSKAAAVTAATIERGLAQHHKHTEDLHRNIEDYMRVQNLLTRQLCSNAAKTDDQRAGCFKP